jgi:hypothetical protein
LCPVAGRLGITGRTLSITSTACRLQNNGGDFSTGNVAVVFDKRVCLQVELFPSAIVYCAPPAPSNLHAALPAAAKASQNANQS